VVYQAGGRVTNAEGKVAFNSPETVEAYEWLKDVYTNPKWQDAMPPGINAWTDPSNNEAYLAGTIGFSSNGGTMVATAFTTKREIVDDTVLIPHPTGPVGKKEARVVAGPYNFHNHIFRGAKNPEAAREMLQILMTKESLTAIWDNSPVLAMPAYKDFGWDLKTFQQVPNNIIPISRRLLWEDIPFQRFQPGPQPKLWIEATDSENIETDVMAEVLKGTPAKEAVANGHARMEKIWEKFEGK
jgi:multiple sugar transport system substrate-binding protein